MRRYAAALLTIAVVVGACSPTHPATDHAGSKHPDPARAATSKPPRHPVVPAAEDPAIFRCPCGELQPGSDPRSLPGPVLVADHLNNRLLIVNPNGDITWEFPQAGDLAPGQSFLVPDDAFFTPDGKYIVATQEDDFVISLIDVATHRIVWRYGTPGVPGSGPDQLWNPDDAMMMPDGDLIAADIKNCRVIVLRPPLHHLVRVYGITTNDCEHDPPSRWGSPNGAFPMSDGRYLVTEINGDWVDSLGLGGQVQWSTHPPADAYPSDTNEVRPGVYLTTEYTDPGMIEEFGQAGQLLWRFAPNGPGHLDQPSLAIPLPDGDILANDDFSHRVIVIDPHTDRIVWQYGHTGVSGIAPGYLDDPDGVDLAPPFSFTITRSATMGEYPVPAGTAPAPGSDLAAAG